MVRTLIMVCLIAVAAGVGWLARGWFTTSASSTEAKGNSCRVVLGRIEQNVKARGIVKPAPNGMVRVGFPFPKDLARRISRLYVVEGDRVQVDALLAQLDHEDLKATLGQLKSELAVFEQRLNALKVLQPVEIRVAEAKLTEYQAEVEFAQLQCNRLDKLIKPGPAGEILGKAASEVEWETARNDLAVSRARLEHAEAGLEQVKAKFRTDISTLEAEVEQAKAAIQSVEVQIRWSTLRSPMNGQVFAVHQRQGELTSGQPTAPVLTLLDPNQLQVHLYVDESDFGRIQVGQTVKFRVESYPEEIMKGRVVRLLPEPMLQENVVYYLAVVEVATEHRSPLRAEMTVLAYVEVGIHEGVLLLPLAAVRSHPDGWYVLRPGSAGPVETPVRIGWNDEGRVEICEGLSEGDEVLLEP